MVRSSSATVGNSPVSEGKNNNKDFYPGQQMPRVIMLMMVNFSIIWKKF